MYSKYVIQKYDVYSIPRLSGLEFLIQKMGMSLKSCCYGRSAYLLRLRHCCLSSKWVNKGVVCLANIIRHIKLSIWTSLKPRCPDNRGFQCMCEKLGTLISYLFLQIKLVYQKDVQLHMRLHTYNSNIRNDLHSVM